MASDQPSAAPWGDNAMEDARMIEGALKLLRVCVGIAAGEEVLIVADQPMGRIARAIAVATLEVKAEPVVTFMQTRQRDGQEPPRAVAAAMRAADVFLAPVSRSITHTCAVKDAVGTGARGLLLTQWRDDMLVAGGIEADFRRVAPLCQAVAAEFERGKRLCLTTRQGTHLEMHIEGRHGNALTCLVRPGQFSPVPTIEANVSPVEGTACGKFIADVSVPYAGIGLLEEPIEAEVRAGYITSISGGAQARRLSEILEGFADPLVYNIAELGIGLNPLARVTGCMLEDEGVYRTAHIGIGTNITLGGVVKAACHYDLLLWEPTIEIDGQVIIQAGVPVLEKQP